MPPVIKPSESGRILTILCVICGALFLLWSVVYIPMVRAWKRKANDLSATNRLHSIINAQNIYEYAHPEVGFACKLEDLAKASNVDLSAEHDGYRFSISNCSSVTLGDGRPRVTGYVAFAVPITRRTSGDRGFCADQSGEMMYDSEGGTNCGHKLGE
jgi:type IV pilus assembly protein PilA